VLAVLGVADAEQLFAAVEAIVDRDPAAALRAAAGLAESGRDSGQVLRDLEVHGRELLAVQVLGDVPPELRVTPERDRRLAEQAQALSRADAVRLLDLVSGALEATANGAQARIQLELVLVKAAAPEVEPSITALLARIERLEAGLGAGSSGQSRTVALPKGAPPPSSTARQAGAAATGVAAAPAAAAAQAVSAPDPENASQPQPAAAGALDLQTAATLWPAVVDAVRERNAMLAALLADARPAAISDGALTLAFPTGAAFLKRKAEQDDHRRVSAEVFRIVTGQAVTLNYELRDEEEEPASPGAALTGEELVQRFLEEFDAEELLDLDDPDQQNGE
jgi:DNA polymerase-3 subunit gamma/tau